jgi:hypothetical protein
MTDPPAVSPAADRSWIGPEAVYTALSSLFAVVLVLTNIIGVKLFVLFPGGRPDWIPGDGPLTLTSGIITYPLTFLLTDLVSEIWGRRRADFMVLLGFLMSLVMLGVVLMARALPPSELWTNPALGIEDSAWLQRAFEVSFYYPGLLLFASMSAYLIAQLFDVRLYHFWWRVTRGRHMWLRNNGSTLLSQLVDTIVVNSIFLRWGLALGWREIAEIIAAVYACKVLLALADTPLVYLGRWALRRLFGLRAETAPLRAPLAGAVPGPRLSPK